MISNPVTYQKKCLPDKLFRIYRGAHQYFEREVKPHVPVAWVDRGKCDALDGEVGIVGFEIPFNRHFYVFQPPRP